ncbi:MAG TPA: hypothetical protein VK364_07880 [Hymenobacter sp.]|nr:hypothetical protein [Hymenobacter sp.]
MPDLSSLQLIYRPDLDLLAARWLTDSTPLNIQAEYEALLVAGQTHATGRWLLDLRRRSIPAAEVAQWVTYDWLPRAAAAMAPIRLRLAYFISPGRRDALRTDASFYASAQEALAPERPYDLQLFSDEGEAVSWLLA